MEFSPDDELVDEELEDLLATANQANTEVEEAEIAAKDTPPDSPERHWVTHLKQEAESAWEAVDDRRDQIGLVPEAESEGL